MLAYPAGAEAVAEFDKKRRYAEQEGRDSAGLGIEIWTSTAVGGEKDWREEFLFWKRAGVTHVTVASTHGRGIHVRIPGRTMNNQIEAIQRYRRWWQICFDASTKPSRPRIVEADALGGRISH